MARTGFEMISARFPQNLKGRKVGVLCHAASINSSFVHIADFFAGSKECRLEALFGPQHGLYGQTQDNMIEWEGEVHPNYKVPLYSLYGKNRKPTADMLKNLDVFIIDLQDVGARLYTYAWTMKLCMEACTEKGIPVWILDRPNPVSGLPYDGAVLKEEFFTFVGGASIPMCHRMTLGEIAIWLKEKYYRKCELNVVLMEGWKRDSFFSQNGLPWVLPSPNMPTLQTAIVYPGTVLFEGVNLSEGRGTTIPFELFGAPYINAEKFTVNLSKRRIEGCIFRKHDFIPTFNKYTGKLCHGFQIHVTDLRKFYPVTTALEILDALIETSPSGSLMFNEPPYEYEDNLIPFDILSGDSGMRNVLLNRTDINIEKERWRYEIEVFLKEFRQISAYRDI